MKLYKDYPNIKETFVVEHYVGTGAQGDITEDRGVVYSTDDEQAAEAFTRFMFLKWNSPEEIASTWTKHHFYVNVNTATFKGKKLCGEFSDDFEKLLNEIKNSGDYREYVGVGGGVITLRHNPFLDDNLLK